MKSYSHMCTLGDIDTVEVAGAVAAAVAVTDSDVDVGKRKKKESTILYYNTIL